MLKNINEIYSIENIKHTFNSYFSVSTTTGRDRISAKKYQSILEQEALIIQRKVLGGNYKFSSFKENLISKGAHKNPRVLSVPTLRDRIVLKILLKKIQNSISFELKLPQQVISECISDLKKYDSFIKLDIKNFYDSIPHNKLMNEIKNQIPDFKIRSLISKALKTPTVGIDKKATSKNIIGIPQGLSISNILAEIYIHRFDTWVKNNFPDSSYFRYVDDMLILFDSKKIQRKTLQASLVEKLSDEFSLTVHDIVELTDMNNENSKSSCGSLIEHKFCFLGYEFSNYKISVRLSSIQNMEKKIAKFCTQLRYDLEYIERNYSGQKSELDWQKEHKLKKCEYLINLAITGCIYNNKRYGWIFYFSKISDLSILRYLDLSICKILNRFGLNGKIKVKRFLKAFYTVKGSKLPKKYIVNFDKIALDIEEQKKFLMIFYDYRYLQKKTDDEIEAMFLYRVNKYSSELEEDLGMIS